MKLFIEQKSKKFKVLYPDSKRKKLTIILVILFILSFASMPLFQALHPPQVKALDKNWEFTIVNRSDFFITGKTNQRIRKLEKNQELMMSQPLKETFQNPVVILRTNHQWTSVYLDRKLLYNSEHARSPGILLTSITLPKNYQGKKIRIVTKTPFKHYIGIPAQVFLGEAKDVNQYFILNSLPQIFIAVISVLFALLTLVPLAWLKEYKRMKLSLLLSAFALLIGLQSFISSIALGTFFSPQTLSLLECLTTLLIPICLTSYYLLRTQHYRKYYLLGVAAQISLLLFALGAAVTKQIPLPESLSLVMGLNVLMTLYTALIVLGESFTNNHFFVICSPGIVIAAIIHCFFYIQLFIGAANLTIDWPLLLFTGLLLLIFGYHFSETLAQLKKQFHTHQNQQLATLCQTQKEAVLLEQFKRLAADPQNGTLLTLLFDYYQAQNENLTFQTILLDENQTIPERYLLFLIHLLEEKSSSSNPCACSLRQVQQHLIIEWQSYQSVDFEQQIFPATTLPLKNRIEQLAGHYYEHTSASSQQLQIKFSLD